MLRQNVQNYKKTMNQEYLQSKTINLFALNESQTIRMN